MQEIAMTPNQKQALEKEELLNGLNEAQKKVVRNYKGFNLVSAAPGAGKTRVLVVKIAYMIKDGVQPSSILAFTFTKKAATEIKERVQSFIGDQGCGVTISTYHSFCARQLRRYAAYAGYKDNFSIVDDDEQEKIIKRILADMKSNQKVAIIKEQISKFKEQHFTPQQARVHYGDAEDLSEALSVYDKYQKTLKTMNTMDFDDLIFNMITILEKNEIVRQQIWNRYKYILADEFQDSSTNDFRFIMLLTNPKTMNLSVVGDEDQAIYAFRGSNVDRLNHEIDKYQHNTFIMGQNYRSTKTVVDAAQSLIKYNPRLDKKVFTDNENGEKILHVTAHTQAQQAKYVANTITALVKSGQMKYGEAAVLFRTNFLSRAVEDAFVKAHIPYHLVSGVSFYKRKEVKDILSFVDFIYNPEHLSSLERIINIPKKGLGEKSMATITAGLLQKYRSYAIINLATAIDCLDEIAMENPRISKKLDVFNGKLANIKNWMSDNDEVTPKDLVDKIITTFDYMNYLESFYKETAEDRKKNVYELINAAASYIDPMEFVEDLMSIDLDESEEAEDDAEDKVHLMSMHASKGLEFRLVFIIDANEGTIPSWRCESEKDIQEERRLFYVAMTRAKENLVICSTNTVVLQGRPRYTHPSSFISQIDPSFIEERSC